MKALGLFAVLFLSLAASAQTIQQMPQLPPPVVPLPLAAPEPQAAAQPQAAQAAQPAAAVVQQVWVKGTDVVDSDGYAYGMSFTVNSSFTVPVCVFPFVKVQVNVYGAVTPGPIQLKPGERKFNIGQFNSADESKPYQIDVGAKFHTGSC